MAQATATATFANARTASFTWALTSNPPTVLSCSVTVTDSDGNVSANVQGAPTNTGGTINASAPFTGTVTVVGSD